MRYPQPNGAELPPPQAEANRRAVRLEWISVAYWISIITLLYFVLGSSQALKAAWIEDILGLFPPIAFLVASRYRSRAPTEKFAWGYHRAITVAYLVAATALLTLGAYILIESVMKLFEGTHPPIGLVELFDLQIWAGWVMLAALVYGVIPPLILGHLKKDLAAQLHDKVLYADARMNRADWLTALAAMGGIVGIGYGLWWADAAAAIFISLDICRDGQRFLREAVGDLMDESPKRYDEEAPHELIEKVGAAVAAAPWVDDGALRLRENGHLISGEVWVVPSSGEDLTDHVEAMTAELRDLDWRVGNIIVSPVHSIEDAPEGLLLSRRDSAAR